MQASRRVVEIDYSRASFISEALTALDEDVDVAVIVQPRLAAVVERAKTAHDAYFACRRSGRRSLRLLRRFGFYGFRTPSLWGALNKAELTGRSIKLERSHRGTTIWLIAASPG